MNKTVYHRDMNRYERMAFGQHEGVHETLNTSEVKRPKFVI